MAIKAGQILHDIHGFVVDRIQTGGVSNLNIPEEKVYELGNYKSVATVRDIPELTFDLESTDMSVEIEALLTGVSPSSISNGGEIDFADSMPIDVVSPFKSGIGAYDIVKGIVIPSLTLESIQYRMAVRQNAMQMISLRGDSVYYAPGTPKYQEFTLVDNTLTYSLSQSAISYTEQGNTIYVLSACVKNPSTSQYKRLFFSPVNSDGYTNTASTITLNTDWYDEGYTKLHVTYATATPGTYGTGVHQSKSEKPAAVRAKDICVYVSNGAATPTMLQWSGVQSFDVQRQVNLDNNEEFCNSKYVSSDYDTADVTGSIGVKSVDLDDLYAKIAQIANVSENVVVGPYSSSALEVEVLVKDPDSGSTLKTLYIPDARFTLPSVQGRVQQKLETTFSFTSDSGTLLVYKGDR